MHLTTLRVLAFLSNGEEHSGEAMAEKLHMSRAAVWKHISELRQKGYAILSTAGKGYKLILPPDVPQQVEVHRYLEATLLGQEIIFLSECDSTNALLKSLAEEGAPEGIVLTANMQTAGRGRRGRTWLAEPGQALLFSVLLRPSLAPRELYGITLMAGVAVVEALAGLGYKATIKWPNDILLTNKKVCGILAEASGEIDHTSYVVLGIGINVASHPICEEYSCTSLQEQAPAPKRSRLLAQILNSLELNYKLYLNGHVQAIFDKWRTHSATLGQKVTAHTSQGDLTGVAKDINAEGSLIISLSSGKEVTVAAGDVSIRAAQGGSRVE